MAWLSPELRRGVERPAERSYSTAATDGGAAVKGLLDEIKYNARKAEEQLWELSHQLKMKTEEVGRLRQQMMLVKHEIIEQEQPDVETMQRIEQLERRAKELQAERQRDRQDRQRLLRRVEVIVSGSSVAGINEKGLLEARGNTASESLRTVLGAMPKPNVEVLEHAAFFTFTQATLSAARGQLRRGRGIDTERCIVSGVAHTGKKLSLNVVSQALSQRDFDAL